CGAPEKLALPNPSFIEVIQMSSSSAFRRVLRNRLLTLIAVALPAASGIAGCSSTDGCHGSTGPVHSQCFAWPAAGAGHAGDAGGDAGIPACPSRFEAGERFAIDQVVSDGSLENIQRSRPVRGGPMAEHGSPTAYSRRASTISLPSNARISQKRGRVM